MSDDLKMGPLQEATLDELIDELAKRFGHYVFAGARREVKKDIGEGLEVDCNHYIAFSENSLTLDLGLCERIKRYVHESMDANSRQNPTEDLEDTFTDGEQEPEG